MLLTALRTLLLNLLGLVALLLGLVALLAMGGAVGAFAYSASKVHGLQDDAALRVRVRVRVRVRPTPPTLSRTCNLSHNCQPYQLPTTHYQLTANFTANLLLACCQLTTSLLAYSHLTYMRHRPPPSAAPSQSRSTVTPQRPRPSSTRQRHSSKP